MLEIVWRFDLEECWRLSELFSRDFESCFDLKHEFLTKMGKICWSYARDMLGFQMRWMNLKIKEKVDTPD